MSAPGRKEGPPTVRLALDGRPGPAARLGDEAQRRIITAALARVADETAEAHAARGGERGHRRLAAAVIIAGVALGGVATAYVGMKTFFVGGMVIVADRAAEKPEIPRRAPPASPRQAPAPLVRQEPVVAPPAEDALGAANDIRARGAWAAAHRAYARAAEGGARKADRDVAALAAASLELEHLSKPREALRRFTRLAASASPGIAEEAAWGVVECNARLQQPADEARALRSFLARFPSSLMRARAEARLASLDR